MVRISGLYPQYTPKIPIKAPPRRVKDQVQKVKTLVPPDHPSNENQSQPTHFFLVKTDSW